jgi:O-antigen ligase
MRGQQWLLVTLVGLALGLTTLRLTGMPLQWTCLLALMVLLPCIAMMVGSVRRLCLGVVLLDIPLQLDIHLAYRPDLADIGAFGGINLSITTFALVVLYALWYSERLTQPSHMPWPAVLRTSFPLLGYLAVNALSILFARDVPLAMFTLLLLGQTFCLYAYIVGTVRTRQDLLFIITMLLIGLLFESLLMIALRGIGHSVETGVILARIDGVRVGGTVGGPNTAAGYLSLLLAPALAILMTRLGRLYKGLATLAFGLGTIALLLTLSRGGWLAYGLSMLLLYGFAWRRGWVSLTIPVVMGMVALALVVFFNEALVSRLSNDDGSAYSRLPLLLIAYRMIADQPIFGVGLNNFAVVMPQYANLEFAGYWLYVVHNKYLIVWGETGLLGLLTFLWFLLTTLRRGWQAWLCTDRFLSPLALGFSAAIFGQMGHMHFDTFQTRPAIQLLWVIAALLTVVHHIGQAETKDLPRVPPGDQRLEP